MEEIGEIQDGDTLYVHGVKDEFPGEEGDGDILSLQDGSYSSQILEGGPLADMEFRRTVAGGIGSLARRLDQLSSQVTGMERSLAQLREALGAAAAQQQADARHQQQQRLQQSAAQHPQGIGEDGAAAGGGAGAAPQANVMDGGEELVRRKGLMRTFCRNAIFSLTLCFASDRIRQDVAPSSSFGRPHWPRLVSRCSRGEHDGRQLMPTPTSVLTPFFFKKRSETFSSVVHPTQPSRFGTFSPFDAATRSKDIWALFIRCSFPEVYVIQPQTTRAFAFGI